MVGVIDVTVAVIHCPTGEIARVGLVGGVGVGMHGQAASAVEKRWRRTHPVISTISQSFLPPTASTEVAQ